ncbi:hypothetical protein GCM10011502_15400 [Oceanisphaera marina]|uniref:Uncharacterized protein n=1 Tax=Oceanisphaera marina TaxID=2017550 RepID=A0ABQ1IL08_9GAMM|nr:hypothetical protein GCM10011502_15400 [Oceanisphaera marina]
MAGNAFLFKNRFDIALIVDRLAAGVGGSISCMGGDEQEPRDEGESPYQPIAFFHNMPCFMRARGCYHSR